MKTFHAILAALILIALLPIPALAVDPVSGWSYEITAEPFGAQFFDFGTTRGATYDGAPVGKAIQRASFDLPSGTTIDYTLWYGNGSTTSGQLIYTNIGLFQQHTEVSMGGITSGYDYTGVQEIGRIDLVGYARNKSSDGTTNQYGLVVYDSVFGISDRKCFVFYPVASSADSVISKISWSSNQPVKAGVLINDRTIVAKATSQGILEVIAEWVAFAIQIAGTIMELAKMWFSGMSFLIMYWWLVLSMYIALTGAMAFNAAAKVRGPQKVMIGIRTFFQYQRSLYDFFTGMWRGLVELIANFRRIF